MTDTWSEALEAAARPAAVASQKAGTTFQQQLLQLRQQQELHELQRIQNMQNQRLLQRHEKERELHLEYAFLSRLSESSSAAAISPRSSAANGDDSVTADTGVALVLPNFASSQLHRSASEVDLCAKAGVFAPGSGLQHVTDEEHGSGADLTGVSQMTSSATAAASLESRIEHTKCKQEHQHSANASSEVKLKLQKVILQRQKGAAIGGGLPHCREPPRTGSMFHQRSSGNLLERVSGAVAAHPYCPSSLDTVNVTGGGGSQFSGGQCLLRKTVSEPNIAQRWRNKQRVLERCSGQGSPGHRRKLQHQQQQHHQQQDRTAGGPIRLKNKINCDAGVGSMDTGVSLPHQPLLLSANMSTNTTIHEEGSSPQNETESMAPLTTYPTPSVPLYSSSSLPNISLGQSQLGSVQCQWPVTEPIAEQLTASFQASPIGDHFLRHFYPVMPVIEGELASYTSAAHLHKPLVMGPAAGCVPLSPASGPLPVSGPLVVSPTELAHQLQLQRLQSSVLTSSPLGRCHMVRTLNRTKSAPLPLGHPMPCSQLIQRAPGDHRLKSLNQHAIFGSVSRAGGAPVQVEDMEEETEQALDQEMMNQAKIMSDVTSEQLSSPTALPDHVKFGLGSRLFMPQLNRSGGVCLAKTLSRTHSSPLVTLPGFSTPFVASPDTVHFRFSSKQGCGTGLVYDPLMLKHQCLCGQSDGHLEHSGRLQAVWSRLQHTDLVAQCQRVRSRKATIEELQLCHSQLHAMFFGLDANTRQQWELSIATTSTAPSSAPSSASAPSASTSAAVRQQSPLPCFVKLPCGGVGVDLDTTWNDQHTSTAARMAAGCVSQLALHVACGELKNGMALVRPPGHHAEKQQAMGFCYFNSVAIAARLLRVQLAIEKVLVVDWDVHHGNGTQQAFYASSHVLYVSVHRHDSGNFFPGTGATGECGCDDGAGFNVNVAWSGGGSMGDAEYMAAFRTVVMPIAKDFEPDVVLVSCGFDAAPGHGPQLGGYNVSAACFGWMTRQLMTLANGKVVLALEGGYHIPAVCDATEQCVRALLGDPDLTAVSESELNRPPCQSAVLTLQETITVQIPHWPCVKRTAHLASVSHSEAVRHVSVSAGETGSGATGPATQQRSDSTSAAAAPLQVDMLRDACDAEDETVDVEEVASQKEDESMDKD